MSMEETLVNEMEQLEIAIKDLEFFIDVLKRPEDYPILLSARNELYAYRQAYETYRSALLRLSGVI